FYTRCVCSVISLPTRLVHHLLQQHPPPHPAGQEEAEQRGQGAPVPLALLHDRLARLHPGPLHQGVPLLALPLLHRTLGGDDHLGDAPADALLPPEERRHAPVQGVHVQHGRRGRLCDILPERQGGAHPLQVLGLLRHRLRRKLCPYDALVLEERPGGLVPHTGTRGGVF
ncbi:hypothetical protein AVEN_182031-1, partial [Araneus ventricosus]